MADGIGLSIDVSFLQKLNNADKQIQELMKKTNDLSRVTLTAFQQMANGGVTPYIEQLNRQKKALEEIAKIKGTDAALIKMQSEAKIAVDEINKVVKALEKTRAYRGEQSGKTAISFANSVLGQRGEAKSINNMQLAIRQLEAAQNRLNLNTKTGQKNYEKIGEAILRVRGELNRVIPSSSNFRKEIEKTTQIAGGLKNALAAAFSVRAVMGYVNSFISIRGEFELYERSLEAILQNRQQANTLWQQTVDLAVKSPFMVKDLVKSTKQLAAYRFETEKIYEVNKMLADISSGVGVDMNRLILALGQVKAANYLRGTELRQFSEAGVNILGKLAEYYTEIENRTVRVGEVFERVSKRMVSYSDVETVLKRMTSAGGEFYRMQEIQSDTLKGQLSNLRDSIDLMLNEVGQALDETLKNNVNRIRILVENWETFAATIKGVAAAFVLYEVHAIATNTALLRQAKIMKIVRGAGVKQLNLVQLLRIGLAHLRHQITLVGRSLKALTANPWLLAGAAAIAGAAKIYSVWDNHRKQLDEINKKYDDLYSKQQEVVVKFSIASRDGDVNKKREQLQQLINIANNDYNLQIKVDLIGLRDEDVEDTFNNLRKKLTEINMFSSSFATQMEKSNQSKKWWRMTSFLGIEDDMFKDIDDLGKSFKDFSMSIQREMFDVLDKLGGKYDTLSEKQKEYYDNLVDVKREGETEVAYLVRLKDAMKGLVSEGLVDEDRFGKFFKRFERDSRRAEKEFQRFIKDFDEEISKLSDEEKVQFITVAVDELATDKKFSDYERYQLKEWLGKEYNITITPLLSTTSSGDELEPWQEEYNRRFSEDIKADKEKDTLAKELTQEYKNQKAIIDEIKNKTEAYITTTGKDGKARLMTEEERLTLLAKEESKLEEIGRQRDFVTSLPIDKQDGKDTVLEKLKNRINLIKEMNKEYEKLNKTFSKAESLAKVQKAYADTAKELGLDTSTMDFTDEGTIKSLEALLGKPEYAANKYVLELKKALDNFNVELGIEVKKGKDQELLNEVQDMFDEYDLSLELKKLNIPPDLAKSLFGIDTINLSDIREKVESELNKAKSVGGQEDRVKQLEKDLEKINDMEDKAQIERLKTYLQYTRDAIGERAKIKIEEMTKLQEIDETFTKAMNEAKTEEDKKRIAEQRKLAEEGVRKESSDKTNKLDWEDFKTSETFVSIFRDLDTASDDLLKHAIERIQEFREEWKDMPIADAKEMINKLNELEMALLDTGKPFADYRRANTDIEAAMMARGIKPNAKRGKSQEELRSRIGVENKEMEDIIAQASVIESVLQSINNATGENKQEQLALIGINEEYVTSLGLSEDVLTNTVEKNEEILEEERSKAQLAAKNMAQNKKTLQQLSTQKNRLEQQADAIGKAQKMANDLYDAFKGLAEALGADSDSPAAIFADMGMSMLNTVLNTIQLQLQLHAATIAAQGLGVAMNAAMGVVGWIVMAIQLLAQLITAIVQANDKRIDAQVEALKEKVEELEKRYDKLAESVDEIYSIGKLRRVSAELENIYEQEKKNLQAAIALRESDKNISDEEWEEIQSLKEDLADLEEQHKKTQKEMMEDLGAVSNVRDATQEFVDAWVDAFKETGDGLSGLQEHFTEFWDDIVAKQATMKVAERFLKPLFDQLEQDLSDYEITQEEAKALKEMAEATMPGLSETLEKIWTALGGSMGETSGGLSALQKGISGMSEQQAEILTAYWNSVRGYTASIDSKMDLILANMGVGTENNPMLEQLISQTSCLQYIKEQLSYVLSPSGTTALKVRLLDE